MGKQVDMLKAEQLGMPLGTAQHRLRMLLMFQLVQQAGRDKCFKCGLSIGSADELSIEHKQPWLHVDPALFWDLGNIAFSHRRCNRPDRDGNIGRRKVGPEGTAWCSGHKDFLPLDSFTKRASRWAGVHSRCKDCRSSVEPEAKRLKRKQ